MEFPDWAQTALGRRSARGKLKGQTFQFLCNSGWTGKAWAISTSVGESQRPQSSFTLSTQILRCQKGMLHWYTSTFLHFFTHSFTCSFVVCSKFSLHDYYWRRIKITSSWFINWSDHKSIVQWHTHTHQHHDWRKHHNHHRHHHQSSVIDHQSSIINHSKGWSNNQYIVEPHN